MREIWKPLQYCQYYQVSNLGRVRTIPRPVKTHSNIIKIHKVKSVALTDNGHGYKMFGTKFNGKKKNFYIHRVVAELFISNPLNLPEVNHKDADKSNNKKWNLEWVTEQGNREHAKLNGLISKGETSGTNKLTELQVLAIYNKCKNNPFLNRTWLANSYGVRDTTVNKIIYGLRWKHLGLVPLPRQKSLSKGFSYSRLATEPNNTI